MFYSFSELEIHSYFYNQMSNFDGVEIKIEYSRWTSSLGQEKKPVLWARFFFSKILKNQPFFDQNLKILAKQFLKISQNIFPKFF